MASKMALASSIYLLCSIPLFTVRMTFLKHIPGYVIPCSKIRLNVSSIFWPQPNSAVSILLLPILFYIYPAAPMNTLSSRITLVQVIPPTCNAFPLPYPPQSLVNTCARTHDTCTVSLLVENRTNFSRHTWSRNILWKAILVSPGQNSMFPYACS